MLRERDGGRGIAPGRRRSLGGRSPEDGARDGDCKGLSAPEAQRAGKSRNESKKRAALAVSSVAPGMIAIS